MKRILAASLTVFLLSGNNQALAQNGSVTVRSSPAGAEVIFEGDAIISGISPVTFRYPMTGEYKLTVKSQGYQDYHSTIVIDPSVDTNLDIKLTRKTGARAAIRSVFIPGWGQSYTDQKKKGRIFTALFSGAILSYLIADHNFDIKNEKFQARLDEYDQALADGESYTQLSNRLTALDQAQTRAYDAEDVRRVTVGVVAGVWALSLLDALFFSPGEPARVTINQISLEPEISSQSIGLKLTSSF